MSKLIDLARAYCPATSKDAVFKLAANVIEESLESERIVIGQSVQRVIEHLQNLGELQYPLGQYNRFPPVASPGINEHIGKKKRIKHSSLGDACYLYLERNPPTVGTPEVFFGRRPAEGKRLIVATSVIYYRNQKSLFSFLEEHIKFRGHTANYSLEGVD